MTPSVSFSLAFLELSIFTWRRTWEHQASHGHQLESRTLITTCPPRSCTNLAPFENPKRKACSHTVFFWVYHWSTRNRLFSFSSILYLYIYIIIGILRHKQILCVFSGGWWHLELIMLPVLLPEAQHSERFGEITFSYIFGLWCPANKYNKCGVIVCGSSWKHTMHKRITFAGLSRCGCWRDIHSCRFSCVESHWRGGLPSAGTK